jgi:tryptophanyl-tRNA synthetase
VQGCKSAGIGCLECKQPVVDAVINELKPMRDRAQEFEQDRQLVRDIITNGSEAARDVARETLDDVVEAMRFSRHS